jgi:hypothetical protein
LFELAKSGDTSKFSESVPRPIFDEIWRENREFLVDRLVFADEYFDFVWALASGPAPRPLGVVQLATRFVFETLIYAKDKTSLPRWTTRLAELFDADVDACRWFITALADGDNGTPTQWLAQITLKCVIPVVRERIVALIVRAARRLRVAERQFLVDAARAGSHAAALASRAAALRRVAELAQHNAAATASRAMLDDDDDDDDDSAATTDRDDAMDTDEARRADGSSGGGGGGVGGESNADANGAEAAEWAAREALQLVDDAQRALDGIGASPHYGGVVRLLDVLLSFLPDIREHWRFFADYFVLLRDLALLGVPERTLLIARGAVGKLCDFYLGDDSPTMKQAALRDERRARPATGAGSSGADSDDASSAVGPKLPARKRPKMGDKASSPKLGAMVDLAMLLVCSLDGTNGGGSGDAAAAIAAMSPFGVALHDDDRDATGAPVCQPVLPPLDAQLLGCLKFHTHLLLDRVNLSASQRLLMHLCWRDLRYSRNVIDALMKQISALDSNMFGPLWEAVHSIATIDDDLVTSVGRFGWFVFVYSDLIKSFVARRQVLVMN